MSRPIRIIHLITTLDVGGAEMALFRLLERMDRNNFQNRVVSLVPHGLVGERLIELGIPVESLGMAHGRPSFAALYRLFRLLRQFRPDVLQTWLYHADLLGLVAGRLIGAPAVIWNLRASDMDMSQYRRLSGWTVRICSMLSRYPQALVVNSMAGLRYHEGIGYKPRRWVLIYNGIDTERFKPDLVARRTIRDELGLDAKTVLIGYIARYDPMKDHKTFLRAARCMLDWQPEAHFLLCGKDITWSNPTMVSLIEHLGLRQRVHLLGLREDISRITSALDLATSTSAFGEGFPNVVAEAMACGVPSVVTDVGDSASIVGNTGLIVLPRDPQELAKGWIRLVDMGSARCRTLGDAARERIQELFSIERMVQAYDELYRETVL